MSKNWKHHNKKSRIGTYTYVNEARKRTESSGTRFAGVLINEQRAEIRRANCAEVSSFHLSAGNPGEHADATGGTPKLCQTTSFSAGPHVGCASEAI
jgi:hypothetical protein